MIRWSNWLSAEGEDFKYALRKAKAEEILAAFHFMYQTIPYLALIDFNPYETQCPVATEIFELRCSTKWMSLVKLTGVGWTTTDNPKISSRMLLILPHLEIMGLWKSIPSSSKTINWNIPENLLGDSRWNQHSKWNMLLKMVVIFTYMFRVIVLI